MNILAMGLPMWGDMEHLRCYRSRAGHEVRHLAVTGPAHYHFLPEETAATTVARVAETWAPDVLLCSCPEFYPPPRQVEHCPIKTVAVVSDWNLYQPQLEHNLARFDLVVTDRLGAQSLHLEGVSPCYFEPIYAHRSLVHRQLDLPRDVDVMFLGNLNHAIHRRRGRLLERVAGLSQRYSVVIDGGYPPEEYARQLNRARIVVNHAVRREMNLRCFEAPACGALLFQEADNLEVGDWLEDGQHAVFYDAENVVEKLCFYLENESLRAHIARQGEQRVGELSAERRMDRFFDWIAAQPGSGRAFRGFSPRTQAMAEVMMLGSSQDAAQADTLTPVLGSALAEFPDDAGFLLAAGCAALSGAGCAGPTMRDTLARDALTKFHEATRAAPEQIIPWLNLAVVARQAGRASLEAKALEMAFAATDADHGGFLLGRVADPYYADWRLALAFGEGRSTLLHALGVCRLARLALEGGDPSRGLEYAQRSIALHEEIAEPHRLAAIAQSRLGDLDGALRHLETGLQYTAFDADHRKDLVAVYRALGSTEAATQLARDSARIFRACADGAATAAEFDALVESRGGGSANREKNVDKPHESQQYPIDHKPKRPQ